ncbi:fungal-specific transcription factor domain-containing protein [Aspergillus pseudoustus]|uniref:Fungal-specific transcription factor domain-containing protein n=1 Tax=Aspergillus pseudoustus TaxID=1810923 RepID=A0ABR4JA18_9EURO
MSQQQSTIRQPQACSYCRGRKVKCDGEKPCGNCRDHQQKCIFLPAKRRGRKHHNYATRAPEALASPIVEPTQVDRGYDRGLSRTPITQGTLEIVQQTQHISHPPLSSQIAGEQDFPFDSHIEGNPQGAAMESPEYRRQNSSGYMFGDMMGHSNVVLTPKDSDIEREEATIDIKQINWEHHGPGSWLSICSKPGIQWVASRAETSQFGQIAHTLVMDWTKHLTMTHNLNRARYAEPDMEKASHYVASYFEYSHDSIFGAVHRPDFETHLRLHHQGLQADDAAHYALRNAVYAVGCRAAAMLDDSASFTETRQLSLKYFQNALSVYTDLLFMPSGLAAVEALIVMTSYAELLGSPSVEYMLCSSAARLAQSKGLHRKAARHWNLPPVEITHRSCVFWTIYCYDKYLSLRCGRPPILDDDDISCEMPTEMPHGSTIDIEVFTAIVNHAQMCSLILKQLCSARSFKNTTEFIFRQTDRHEEKLQEWRSSLPPGLRPESISNSKTPLNRRFNLIRLHIAYHGSNIALHANTYYPWINSFLISHGGASFRARAAHSSEQVAASSRQILLSLKHLNPDLMSLSPVSFYYPMLATINLFIYILKSPTSPTVQPDLALLDIASGHFGQIYHLTSGHVSFSFPREAIRIAERAVQVSRMNEGTMGMYNVAISAPHASAEGLFDTSRADNLSQSSIDNFWSGLPDDFFDDFVVSGDMITL